MPQRAKQPAQELTNDRLVSEADLARLLGTLRYLQGLKTARQQVEAEAEADNKEAFDQPSASIGHSESPLTSPPKLTNSMSSVQQDAATWDDGEACM